MSRRRVLLCWSSGKDCAWTLHELRRDPGVEVVALLCVFDGDAGRVAMHAVRRELVERQAEAAGVELWPAVIPARCSNEVYERAMAAAMVRAREAGVAAVAFGDLFLADVRAYRERMLAGTGLAALFPLWGRDTASLAQEMLAGGLRATVTCVDLRRLPADWSGRGFDRRFLAGLPATVDPCGENGEFHSFAWDGPMFARRVACRTGERVVRDGFAYTDLLAADG